MGSEDPPQPPFIFAPYIEAEIRGLTGSRPKGLDLERLAATLPDAVAKIKKWVLAASEDDMELILRALHIQIAASREKVQIEGSVPAMVPEDEFLVTIVQTSGCMFLCDKPEAS